MASKSEFYNTGGGELFFTPIVNGVKGTEEAFGQTSNVSYSTEVEELKNDNTEGCIVYEDISIIKKITGKLTLETLEISPAMLTRAFLGTDATVEVSKGVGLDYDVTVDNLGTAYPIGVKYVSDVIVKDDTDTTTYVENVDYLLDADKGTITALDTGSITAGDILHVTADNAKYDEIRIEAFTKTKIEGTLRFVSCSANGVSYTYTFHRVSISASGDFSLKNATEFAKLTFNGDILADETQTGTGVSKLFNITGSRKAS